MFSTMVAVLVINEVSNLTYLNLFSPTPQIIHLYFKRRDRMVSRSVYILIALRIFCIRFLFGTSLSQSFLLHISNLLEKQQRTTVT